MPYLDEQTTIREKAIMKMSLYSLNKSSSEPLRHFHPKTSAPSNLG